METKILRVVRQGEAFSVQSSKQESGSLLKCNIVLRELGGQVHGCVHLPDQPCVGDLGAGADP